MGLLDNVESDKDPIVATIDFNKYVDGDKLSTLARSYYQSIGVGLGAASIEEYFAIVLLSKLKETLAQEALAQVYQVDLKAAEELAAAKAIELDQKKIEAAEIIIQKQTEIFSLALEKKEV